MSRYLDAFIVYLENIQKSIAAEPSPHKKAILKNYLAHATCEFSGNDQYIFRPSRTVAQPVYHVKIGPQRVTYRGQEAVQAYYNATNEEIVMLNDEVLMVSDWGLSSYSTLVRFVSGAKLIKESWPAHIDGKRTYLQTYPLAMFWPYDAEARMIGEDVWQLDTPTVSEPAPEDIVTLEMRARAAERFLPALEPELA
jgi:hypothetical protein